METEGEYEELLEEESYEDSEDNLDEDTDDDIYSAEEEAFMRGYKEEADTGESKKKKIKEEFCEDEDY